MMDKENEVYNQMEIDSQNENTDATHIMKKFRSDDINDVTSVDICGEYFCFIFNFQI